MAPIRHYITKHRHGWYLIVSSQNTGATAKCYMLLNRLSCQGYAFSCRNLHNITKTPLFLRLSGRHVNGLIVPAQSYVYRKLALPFRDIAVGKLALRLSVCFPGHMKFVTPSIL